MPAQNIDLHAPSFKRGRSFPSLEALLEHLCLFEEHRCISLCLGNAKFMVAAGLVVRGQTIELWAHDSRALGSATRPLHLTASRDILVAWLRSLVPDGSDPLAMKVWYDAPRPLRTEAHGVAYVDTRRGTYVWIDAAGREKDVPLKPVRRNSQQLVM